MMFLRSYTVAAAVAAAIGATTAGEVRADDAAAQSAELEQVVVTGSRIERPELDSAMPVSVVDMGAMERLGRTNVYDALLRETALGPGTGPYNVAPENTTDGGVGVLELRNMGANRSLTLIDGKRRVSGTQKSSSVDVNMIPSAMVERVEIITGGAAAVYGADAVTGAVNIITKREIDGTEVTAKYGMSERGDAENSTFSLATGTRLFGDRGSVSIGGSYRKQEKLFQWDRDYTAKRLLFVANNANTGPADGIPDRLTFTDVRNFYYSYEPTITVGPFSPGGTLPDASTTYVLQPDGSVVNAEYDYQFKAEVGERSGGNGGNAGRALNEEDLIVGPSEAVAFIGRFGYELTDAMDYELRVDHGRNRYDGSRRYFRLDSRPWLGSTSAPYPSPSAKLDNPFLPAAFRDIMTSKGVTSIPLDRSYSMFGILGDISERETTTVINTLEGDLPRDFRWEVFHQYGRYTNEIQATNTPIASHFSAAWDVVADPVSGTPVCRNAAARAAGCVPFNIFGFDELTPEQRSYLLATRHEKRTNTQTAAGASLVGKAFSLPAGDVRVALGVEYRKEAIDTKDDPRAESGELAYTATWSQYHPAIKADFNVKEVFGELVIPVLADLPFAHSVELEGAYRYSDYNTFGSTNAWKLGGTWSPIETFTFRGVKSKSVRTPNFGELFDPQTLSTFNPTDPCEIGEIDRSAQRRANCAALGLTTPLQPRNDLALQTAGGNPELNPESSDSLTIGFVWRPFPSFDVSVDYWKIEIDNAVTSPSAANILNYCVDGPSIDNPFCDRIVRGADGYVTDISRQSFNAAVLETNGIDVGINYSVAVGDGQLKVGARGTFLDKFETRTGTLVNVSDGTYGNPDFLGTLFASYSIGNWDVGMDTRYRSSSINVIEGADAPEYVDDNHVESYIYNDATVSYHFDQYSVTGGVNNVFGVEPPFHPNTYEAGGYYDMVGRSYFLSLKAQF